MVTRRKSTVGRERRTRSGRRPQEEEEEDEWASGDSRNRNRKKKDACAVVVAIGTWTGGRKRSYGHCSFIYIIRVKSIFAISPYVLGAPAKMLGAPSNSPQTTQNVIFFQLAQFGNYLGHPAVFINSKNTLGYKQQQQFFIFAESFFSMKSRSLSVSCFR